MSEKTNPKIILEDKEYELEKIHISELNFLMVRLFDPIGQKYTTYNLGTHNPNNNFIKNEIEKNR